MGARNALTETELAALIKLMFDNTSLSVRDPSTIKNETAKVLNKIGLMVFIQGQYVDKLEEMDGPELPLGKTIEEWFLELPNILDEDRDGSEDGTPEEPSFLSAYYSYSLPKKRVKTTRRYDEYEEACYTEAQYISFTAAVEKSLADSTTVFRYGLKRELLGRGIALIESIIDGAAAASTVDGQTIKAYVASSANLLEQGDYVRYSSGGSTYHGIVLANKGEIAANTSWADAVEDGDICVYDLATTIAKPTDSATGEAFIETVLDDVEIASDNSSGHSLNGATIGAVSDLRLYTLHGIKSKLSVKVKAGAFHRDELELGAKMTALPDFGEYNGKTWAVLCDSRMFVLYTGYMSVRTRENADGDFLNFVRHMKHTPFMSRSTFIRLYRTA